MEQAIAISYALLVWSLFVSLLLVIGIAAVFLMLNEEYEDAPDVPRPIPPKENVDEFHPAELPIQSQAEIV